MKIGITGASGFIAGQLIPRLSERGHECIAFSRSVGRAVTGCRETRALAPGTAPDLAGVDAVVNLAGESILGRWTAAKKRRVRDSRLGVTRQFVDAMSTSPVRVLISASASGLYGDRGDEMLTEASAPGRGFLADVCREWEAEALRARTYGARVALPRIGFVVAPRGGAMERLRPLFRLGLGGRLGDGRQWMPWVHVSDVAGLIVHLLEHETLDGPFHAAAPNPVRNDEFTRALATAVHRPAFCAVPAFALRLALGELSGVALDSTRLAPLRTLGAGYAFEFSQISEALR